jgi:hypothetical protein
MTAPGVGLLLGDNLLEEHLQGFPGQAAQIVQKLSIIQKVPSQDLRDAEDKMPVRNLFQVAPARNEAGR